MSHLQSLRTISTHFSMVKASPNFIAALQALLAKMLCTHFGTVAVSNDPDADTGAGAGADADAVVDDDDDKQW